MFYLMDVLEPISDDETPPPNNKEKKEGKKAKAGHEENSQIAKETRRRSGMEEWQDGSRIPDWLHGKNPLNVSESLTEWMLLALMEKLEHELGELRKEGNTVIE